MSWVKEEPLTEKEAGFRSGCLNCGPQPIELPLDSMLAVGFGAVSVTKNGKGAKAYDAGEGEKTVQDIEDIASQDPDHDWRIAFFGPLSETEYQRQGGKWILIKKGQGFA